MRHNAFYLKKYAAAIRRDGKIFVPGVGDLTLEQLQALEARERAVKPLSDRSENRAAKPVEKKKPLKRERS